MTKINEIALVFFSEMRSFKLSHNIYLYSTSKYNMKVLSKIVAFIR